MELKMRPLLEVLGQGVFDFGEEPRPYDISRY